MMIARLIALPTMQLAADIFTSYFLTIRTSYTAPVSPFPCARDPLKAHLR